MIYTLSTIAVGTVLECGAIVVDIVLTSWGAWVTLETPGCTVHRAVRNGDTIKDYLF